MNDLELIAAIVASLAWPVAIIVSMLIIKREMDKK